MDSIGNPICCFCEHSMPSVFMRNYDETWICDMCDDMYLPLKHKSQEINECPVCYENKKLVGLPTCNHSLCLQCCKAVYFGTTKNERPKSFNEIVDELLPEWPYDIEDEGWEGNEKCKEYEKFVDIHFLIEEKTYDELITIRNNLISERPEWMNAEEIIIYENANFRYHTECQKADEDWRKYNETKNKGNSKCPLCRKSVSHEFEM